MPSDPIDAAVPGQPVSLTQNLRVLRAANPSPLTGSGTNSYLIGRGEVTVLDPGPADPAHLQALLAALRPGERITRILISHAHLDHSALAPALKAATHAPVLAFGTARDGLNPAWQGLSGLGGGEGCDHSFTPDIRLADGQILTGDDWQLEALHTPGHLGNHLCFVMGEGIFSADLAMGWATSIVSPPDGDMSDYMASLDRLIARAPKVLWPGHGAPVDPALPRLEALRAHRLSREAQILTALHDGPGTAAELAARIYTEVDPSLLPAASRNVLAHLLDLSQRRLAAAHPAATRDALWSLPEA
ncbi:MBL fold metallo-hydrolase [Falsigemmobacter faecalis]|uniref:MBL fold metallo-hydrolase n=1 Tax=Falsigemmobacter faecalis TaxID=2488730 RepID=A0A3P3DPW9_9RHOB|nr:MBL fold metallo-hydrolase [Falsigemmobacter faecalis]RRH76299.1 MBL fold metallo-hydrolase [Falsigemmobacter faecalis]